jgi:hypothetical protein
VWCGDMKERRGTIIIISIHHPPCWHCTSTASIKSLMSCRSPERVSYKPTQSSDNQWFYNFELLFLIVISSCLFIYSSVTLSDPGHFHFTHTCLNRISSLVNITLTITDEMPRDLCLFVGSRIW